MSPRIRSGYADVVVVGAGPVGLMLAAQLRLGGADVTVLERLSEPTGESRASTLHARTMEIFDQNGLLDRLGTVPNDLMGHFGGIPLSLGELATPFPGQWKVPQTQTEQLLGSWAAELGARVVRGASVVSVIDSGEYVEVGLGGGESLRAAYVVGCDGETSTVRTLAGFAFPGHDSTRELLRADVAGIDVPDRRFERLAGGLAIASRRGDGVTRIMVHEYGRPPGARGSQPTYGDVAAAWAGVTGENVTHGNPLWVNSFGNARRQAAQYRRGRVFLAGDAAHQQMPAGGQALNLGLQDAVNLGWKLAAQVAGRAAADLLDSYQRERHAVGARILANIDAQATLLLSGSDVDPVRTVFADMIKLPQVRDHLAAMISGLDVCYNENDPPLLGRRVPPMTLQTSSSTRTSFTTTAALLRAGRPVLLDFSADPDRQAELQRLTTPGGGVERLVSAVAPADGPVAGYDTVLVRPDGYVAWVGDRLADPRPALSRS